MAIASVLILLAGTSATEVFAAPGTEGEPSSVETEGDSLPTTEAPLAIEAGESEPASSITECMIDLVGTTTANDPSDDVGSGQVNSMTEAD